jgi:hypothetical protein
MRPDLRHSPYAKTLITITQTTMKNLLIFVFIFLTEITWSQNIVFEWNKILGEAGPNVGICIKVDTADFIYASGCFSGSIDFLGTYLTSKGNLDAYLAKMDSKGGLIWVKQFSGNYNDKITSLEIDRDNNIYVCGSYRVNISFDTTLITNNADTLYSSNMFIAKYSPSGKLSWAKNTGGVEFDGSQTGPVEFGGNRLTADSENNLIIAGKSIDINLFDTSGQIQTLDSGEICNYYGGIKYCHWEYFHPTYNFIAKYNSDGEKIWIKLMGGDPYAVKTDNKDNIIVSGNFQCWTPPCNNKFDSVILNPISGETIFLVKYNNNGKLLWAQTAGGLANYNTGYDLAIDSINNIYITGQIMCGEIRFGESIGFSIPCDNVDAFLAKCDSSGDFKWAKIIGTPVLSDDGDYNSGNSMIITNNNILITGYFKDTIDFNGSVINGLYDMFVAKFDLNGNAIKAGAYASSDLVSISSGKDIFFDRQNNIYVTGYTYFDATSFNNPCYIYIAKISYDIPTSFIKEIQNKGDIMIHPNPCKEKIIITSNSNCIKYIQIISINGTPVLSGKFQENIKEINCSSLSKGIYIAKINIGEELIVRKLIKE